MSKKAFWIRLSFYILFGGIFPIVFIALRFNLFHRVSALSLSGWKLIFLIFIAIFYTKLLKQVQSGLPFSYTTQIISGLAKVIVPLIIAVFALEAAQDYLGRLIEFLICCIVCESCAILVNPLPQWRHENKIEETGGIVKSVIKSAGLGKFFKIEK